MFFNVDYLVGMYLGIGSERLGNKVFRSKYCLAERRENDHAAILGEKTKSSCEAIYTQQLFHDHVRHAVYTLYSNFSVKGNCIVYLNNQ